MKKLFLRISAPCLVCDFRIAKLFLTVLCFISVIGGIQGQTMMLGTTVGGGTGYSYTNYTMTNYGAFWQQRVQENYSTSAGSRGWEFNADSYYNTWRASYNYQQVASYNTEIFPSSSTASAYWRNSSGGSTAAMLSTTSGNYYTFNITYEGAGASYQNQEMEILETTYNPTVISSVSQAATSSSVYPNCSVTVTATLASTPNTGEYFYIRYTTNAFSTTTAALMSVSGTSATATIPAQAAGTTVSYYIFSSNTNSLTLTGKGSDYYDCATLNFINNGGSNYSYTVLSAPTSPTVSIAASPSGAVCTGTSVGFTATPANAGSSPTYAFYVNGTSVQTGSSNIYSYTPANSDAITCYVTNNTTCTTSASSNSITESVNALPSMTSISQPTVCAGSVGVIYLTGLANSVSYTVNYNYSGSGTKTATFTSNSSGNTGNFNTYQALQSTDNGNTFTITSITNNATSCVNNTPSNNTVPLSVSSSVTPALTLGASATTICAGTSVLFTATPTSGSGLSPTYNFEVNGSSVQNSSSSTYSTTTLTNGQVVNCIMTSSSACASPTTGTSGNITMTVNTASVAPTGISGTTTVCSGNGTVLTATGGTLGTGATYQWGTGSTIGTSPVSGATSVTYSVTPSSNTTYWVSVTGTSPCGSPSGGATQLVTLTGNTWLGGTSTDWNVATNWCTGIVPSATTNVIIPSGTTYSPVIGVSGANALCNSLTINSGATLTMQSAYTLTVTSPGTLTNNGTFTAGNGTVAFPSGSATVSGTIAFYNVTTGAAVNFGTGSTINNNLSINSGGSVVTNYPTYGSASTLTYNTGSAITAGYEWKPNATSGAGVPQNVSVTGSATNINFGASANYYQLNGVLTIASGSTFTQSTNGGSAGLKFAGGLTNNGTYNDNGRGTWWVGGASTTGVIQSSGALTLNYLIHNSTSTLQFGSSNISIAANTSALQFLSTGGIDLLGNTLTINSGATILLNAAGAKTITSSSGTGTLAFAGSATITPTSGSLITSSTVTNTLAGGLTIGGASALTVNGILQLNGGGYVVAGNAPVYGSGSTLIYNSGGSYGSYTEWTAGATSGAGVPANVQIGNGASGSALSLGSGTFTMTGTLTFSANTGAALTSSGTLNIGGNYVNNTSNAANLNGGTPAGTIVFNGSVAQSISGSNINAGGYDFNSLTINNTSGGVTLSDPVTVANVLTLTSGLLTTTTANTVSVTNNATTAVAGGSTTSYVNGPLNWTLPTTLLANSAVYNFPVGASTYLPFSMTTLTGASPIVQVQAFSGNAGGTADGTTVSALSSTEYWEESLVSGSLTLASVTLTRQTAISPYNIIAESATKTGTYSSVAGTASTYSVSGSTPAGPGYFAFGTSIVPAPTISSVVSNTTGGNSGFTGSTVTITGTNFTGATAVSFGGTAATSYTVVSATQITAVVGAGASGNVTVTTLLGSANYSGFVYMGYITANNGDWNTGSTWLGGGIPPAASATTIANTVTANSTVANAPASDTIRSGSSLSIGSSGALTVTNEINNGTLTVSPIGTLTIAASGTLTNNGSCTGGGTVNFAGAGTINGTKADTIRNLTINTGTVTVTTAPVITGTFLINGGSVTSGPIYGASSTLQYNSGGTYNRGVEWNQNSTTVGTSGAPNNVTISNSTTLNYPPSGATPPSLAMAGSLTINSGSALYMDYGSPASSNPLTVKGNVNLIGSLSLGNQAGGDIYVGGNWIFVAGGTFNTNYRAVFFNGSSQQIIERTTPGTLNFDYIVDQNTSGGLQLYAGTNININAHNGGNGLSMSSAGTAIDLNGDTLFLTASQSISTSGSNTIMSSTGTGVIDVAINTTCTMTGSGTLTFGPAVTILLIGGTSGSMNFGSGISTIINGTLQLNSGSYVTGNAPTYGTGSNLVYNTGTVYSRNVEFGTTSGAGYPYNVIVQNGTFLDLSNTNAMTQNVGIANNLTISGGSSGVGLNNSAYSLLVGGNVTIGSGTNGLYLSTVTGGDIYVGGNWTNNGGNFGAYSRAVFFTGSKIDTITPLATDTFAYLIMQKTSSANSALLTVNTTVTDGLTLTMGILNTGSDTLTVKSTASGAVSGYSASSYVNGFLRRYVASSTSYDFPVGSAGNYELANITFNSGLTGTSYLTANFNPGGTTAPSVSTCFINGSAINTILNAGYWSIHPDVQPTTGTYNSTLNLIGASNVPTANTSGLNSMDQITTITPAEQIGLIKRANSASPWLGCGVTTYGQSGTNQNLGNTTTVGGTISGSTVSVSRANVPTFSDFGIGVEANSTYALPVQLIYFTAEANGKNALLNWATASETNNAYFAVERSTDGANFTQIGQVAGHGNSVVTIDYQYTDEDITSLGAAILYYRLKQVDVDGNATYTNIAAVDVANTNSVFHVISSYPNPFTDHLSVTFFAPQESQTIKMSLYDMQGQLVSEKSISTEAGLNVYSLSDAGHLASGLYVMNITVGNQNYSLKLVKGE